MHYYVSTLSLVLSPFL